MEHEIDYKKAYKRLDTALMEAIHILTKARLHVYLRAEREAGRLTAEDETDLQSDIEAFLREYYHPQHE